MMIRSEIKTIGSSFSHVFRAIHQVHLFTESFDRFIGFSLFFHIFCNWLVITLVLILGYLSENRPIGNFKF